MTNGRQQPTQRGRLAAFLFCIDESLNIMFCHKQLMVFGTTAIGAFFWAWAIYRKRKEFA